jgi:hypothetical protein
VQRGDEQRLAVPALVRQAEPDEADHERPVAVEPDRQRGDALAPGAQQVRAVAVDRFAERRLPGGLAGGEGADRAADPRVLGARDRLVVVAVAARQVENGEGFVHVHRLGQSSTPGGRRKAGRLSHGAALAARSGPRSPQSPRGRGAPAEA